MRPIDADALEKKLQEQRELYVEMGMKGAEHLLVHDFLRYVWEAPTVIHLCEVCKNMHNTWDSETCDGCTGRESNFSPIDPVRQPHAMWINQDVRHMGPVVDLQAAECSACGRWLTTPYLYSFKHYEYCPYCGAKMDRGDEYETD